MVRPKWNDPVQIERLLDSGFYNFLIPFVESAAQAQAAVAATRYPPQGVRGAQAHGKPVGILAPIEGDARIYQALGILRDVLLNRVPIIFEREIYASAALVGAVIVVLGQYFAGGAN